MSISIVLGGSANVWQEFEAAKALMGEREYILIACNHAMRDARCDIGHAATMHPDLFPLWLAARKAKGYSAPGRLWHARHRPLPKGLTSTPIENWGGSSGLLCVAVAFELGVERIVLAGVPMRKTACHYDDPRHWEEARGYWPAWERHEPRLRGRVKSMSGWTADLLGTPTGEWLNADATRPALRTA